jgi:hypothetical protein
VIAKRQKIGLLSWIVGKQSRWATREQSNELNRASAYGQAVLKMEIDILLNGFGEHLLGCIRRWMTRET